MGKVSPPSIKYVINAQFSAEGVVEKPDVIGAIFGQTEGLLGEELELRELQKKGKIGRINATIEVAESKTIGIIEIPTSIDKAETTIIAAAIETIDRVGPCDAKFEVKSIEDVRSSKRDYIIERAKKLMEGLNGNIPELKEIERDIVNHSRTAKIKEYGREMLAAGPDIDKSDEIIIVEGRADVLNLLTYGMKNAIAMNGTMIPKTVTELSKEKQAILFVDGDRGGILIATDAINNADINFVARAPDGKEVEELTGKEIIICLRNKMSVKDFLDKYKSKDTRGRKTGRTQTSQTRQTRTTGRTIRRTVKKETRIKIEPEEKLILDDKQKKKLEEYLGQIKGTKNVLIINRDLKIMRKVSSSEIVRYLYGAKNRGTSIPIMVLDTAVTVAIINAAEKINCQFIVARNFAATSEKIELLSF